jgi:hypothetical protein
MEPLNPVDIENRIRELVADIAKGVKVVSEAYSKKLTTERIYDHAFAVAYLTYAGAANAKKYAAETRTQQERIDRDVADAAFSHAQRQMRAYEGELSAFQTMNKSVAQMYGAAGSGRGQ